MTVVNFPRGGPGVTGQASSTTGWRVGRQGKPSSGMPQLGRPKFSPKVKKAVCSRASSCAAGSCRWRTWVIKALIRSTGVALVAT